jgi:hypothetical protein
MKQFKILLRDKVLKLLPEELFKPEAYIAIRYNSLHFFVIIKKP